MTNTATIERQLYTNADLNKMGLPRGASRWRLVNSGDFPQPVKIGGKVFYAEEAVDAFIADLKNQAMGTTLPLVRN